LQGTEPRGGGQLVKRRPQRRKHVRVHASLVRFNDEERALVARAAASESRVVAQFLRIAGVQAAARVLAVDRRRR
jgi:uncharacterized protein (DUF1778 family)